MMKRMAVAVMMAAGMLMVPARGQVAPLVKDELFMGTEKFEKNAVKVTEITMDPQSLGMVDGKDKDKARSMKLNVTREYHYDKPGMYNMADVDAYRNKLNTGDWYCSVRVRDLKEGKSTDVCQKRRSDELVESAIITVEPTKLTFIHRIGTKGSWSGSYSGYYGGRYDDMGMLAGQIDAETQMAMMQGMSISLDSLKNLRVPSREELKVVIDRALREPPVPPVPPVSPVPRVPPVPTSSY